MALRDNPEQPKIITIEINKLIGTDPKQASFCSRTADERTVEERSDSAALGWEGSGADRWAVGEAAARLSVTRACVRF